MIHPALAWIMLLIGIGYLFMSIIAKMLNKQSKFVDFGGALVLTAAGTVALKRANDAGWFYTLVLAGFVVGIICMGASLTRWSGR